MPSISSYLAWLRLDVEGRVEAASQPAAILLGYADPEAITGTQLLSAAAAADSRERLCRQPGEALELRLERRDGINIWILLSGQIVDGLRIEGWVVEITPYKRSESALAASQASQRIHEQAERRFRALMESAPDAILISSRAGRILMANRQSEALLGCPREQIIGRSIEDFMPERFRQRHLYMRAGYNQHPQVRPMGIGLELYALRADGVEIPVEISLSPIELDGESVVASAIRDVSERKRAEQALKRLHQLELAQTEHLASLGEIAAGLAHEIKNPLAGIAAVLEVLVARQDSETRELMGEVQQQVVRIRSIVDELLNYARPRPLNLVSGDLNTAVGHAVQFSLPQAQRRRLRLAFLPEALPPLRHDPEQIQRMVLNLVMNAIEALAPGGAIEVQTRSDNGQAVITVTDDGPGIAPADQEKIFRPFYTTKGQHGTGLGLSLCRRIAELHGGQIRVHSRPGEGSRFEVRLPLEAASGAVPA